VLEELDAEDSPLYDLIDDALQHPYTPGERPRTNVTELIRLGQAILNIVARVTDDAVSMRQACREVPHD
jgi:hypothetical protein